MRSHNGTGKRLNSVGFVQINLLPDWTTELDQLLGKE